tara:strand:+ start:4410 stop:5270 length:861 start_codon:yes stop_codon:yes gene_type:complete
MVNPISHKNKIKKGLYLVPTPIGNLADITYRAVEILKISDYILCEDTRVSRKLFNKFGVKSKLIPNHKFNEVKNLSKLITLLKDNKIISLISDAGTPSISDPGTVLVNECLKESINVFPLPGSSAVTTAMSASGFSEKFLFYGFFPSKELMIKKHLTNLSDLNFSLVFFVSPKKINKVIPHIKKYFKNRKIVICREISKIYEEYIRSTVEELKLFNEEPKGEITIVLSEKDVDKKASQILSESDKRNIEKMINKLSIKEITELIRQNSKISKKEIYNYCLKLKNEK